MNRTNDLIARIARQHLGIETLETRNRDALDFHDVSAAGLKNALLAAYQAGSRTAAAPVVVITVRGGLIEDVAATVAPQVVVEDWDVPDQDTGERPRRSVWKLDAGTSGPTEAQRRRLNADE